MENMPGPVITALNMRASASLARARAADAESGRNPLRAVGSEGGSNPLRFSII